MRDTTLNTDNYKVDAKSLFEKAKKQKQEHGYCSAAGAALAITGAYYYIK